ncbi:MAG: hypothetical protein Q9219_001901 [cf. Caloplaca sp. 3 TL-2023]
MAEPKPSRQSSSSSLRSPEAARNRSDPNIFSDEYALEPLQTNDEDSTHNANNHTSNLHGGEENPTTSDTAGHAQRRTNYDIGSGSIRRSFVSREGSHNDRHASIVSRSDSYRHFPAQSPRVSLLSYENPASAVFRSSSQSSNFTISRTQSPYQGATGPSHPYGMYPQDIGVFRTPSTTTASTARARGRSYTGPSRPSQPYGMYSQNTVPEDAIGPWESLHPAVPVGFPGRPQNFQRPSGAGAEDADDFVGPDGYAEYLPPYTRYPDGIPPKSGRPGPASLLSVERQQQAMSEETLSDPFRPQGVPPQNNDRTYSSTELTAVAPGPLPEDDGGGNFKERAKEKGKKRICFGTIPLWVIAILIIVIVAVLAGVIGAVVGRARGERQATSKPPPNQPLPSPAAQSTTVIVTTTSLVDATPLTSTLSNLPSLPTGTFYVPLRNPTISNNSCLSVHTSAWGCANTVDLRLDLSIPPMVSVSPRYPPMPNQIRFGPQPPQLDQPVPLSLMADKDEIDKGPAWFFQEAFTKIVVVPDRMWDLEGEEKRRWLGNKRQLDVRGHDFTQGIIAPIAAKPWFCYWNNTYLEGFIYVTQNFSGVVEPTSTPYDMPAGTTDDVDASAVASLGYEDSPPASATSFLPPEPAMPTEPIRKRETADPSQLLAYSKDVKIEERRDPNVVTEPYCVHMQIMNDGSAQPLPEPIISLLEDEPDDYPIMTPGDERKAKRDGLWARHSATSACECEWQGAGRDVTDDDRRAVRYYTETLWHVGVFIRGAGALLVFWACAGCDNVHHAKDPVLIVVSPTWISAGVWVMAENGVFYGHSETITREEFFDTASCRCALRQIAERRSIGSENTQAWRCTADLTQDIYHGLSGKWYFPKSKTNKRTRRPDTTTWFTAKLTDDQSPDLRFLDPALLSPRDEQCTAVMRDQERPRIVENENPLLVQRDAPDPGSEASANSDRPSTCMGGPRAVAVPIQDADSWQNQGCLPGFLCVLLPSPKSDSGLTWCTEGASCPEGTNRDMSFLPPAMILAADIIVLVGMMIYNLQTYFKNKHKTGSKGKRFSRLNKPASFFDKNQRLKKYQSLQDDDVALESRITQVQRSDTGFGGNMTPIDANADDELISDIDLFIQSISKCIGTEKFGLSFEYTDLKFQPKKASKPILSEVTGKIDRGSLWGVMGASGAGKSTFVNVLMGKQAHTGGVTKINGVPGDIKKYKKIIGYVPQDDIVLPELTVRENILHSARIRLPSNWSDSQIQKHVDTLISCLQLAHVKDSLVGSAAKPVISGGQRKRVSIGIELAAAPMALFLDEPTSGLDATSASSIMMTLKELSRLNITVITIIHQPRAEIFESLDSLLLFGKGRVIYQGPEQDCQAYFENLGFRFPSSSNPADTIMDIIAGQGHLYKPAGDSGIWPLIHNWKRVQESQTLRPESSISSLSSSTPASSILQTPKPHHSTTTTSAAPSPLLLQTPKSRHRSSSTTSNANKTEEALSLRRSIQSRGAPFHLQTYHCLSRSLLQQYRLRSSFYFEIGVSALGGFLIGLAQFKAEGVNFRGFYHQPYTILSSSIDYASVPQMALLVGIAIGLIASSPGVKIFGEEKLVYWREAGSGHNRFAYYVGKVLSTFPRMVLACAHFTATFMLLATPRISWLDAFLANFLYFFTIYGLASCLSMLARREDGPLLAVMASLIVGVLNGMSPNLRTVAEWHMTWFWRALPGTWLAEAYFEKNVKGWAYLYDVRGASEASGLRLGRFGWDCCVLGLIGCGYRVVAFGLMRGVGQRGKG